MAAGAWFALIVLSRMRTRRFPNRQDRLLLVAFGFGLTREILMIVGSTLIALRWVDSELFHTIFPPAEHALQNIAMTVIAAAYMRVATGNGALSARYIVVGAMAMVLCYLATFRWWANYITENPASSFGQTWCDMLFHVVMSAVLAFPIAYLLLNAKVGSRTPICAALLLFWLFVFLKIPDIMTGEDYKTIYAPSERPPHEPPRIGRIRRLRSASKSRSRSQQKGRRHRRDDCHLRVGHSVTLILVRDEHSNHRGR
jgi:hypothetical protein